MVDKNSSLDNVISTNDDFFLLIGFKHCNTDEKYSLVWLSFMAYQRLYVI